MKNLSKITSIALIAAMAFGLAGCSLGGGKLAASKLKASAKKYGAEEYKDADDFEDLDDDEIEDGAYITLSGKDSKDFLKDKDMTEDFYDKNAKSVTIFAVGEEDESTVIILNLSFGSKKNAESYYDDMVEIYEDYTDSEYADVESDDGEEKGVTYSVCTADAGYIGVVYGVYMSGSNVLIVMGVGDVGDCCDYIDDVASCYDIVLPSEL